jgi:predicted nucleic acid-binding protein
MGINVLSPSAAFEKVAAFLALPEVRMLSEPHGLEEAWRRFSSTPGSPTPNLWTDSYLAAFAVCGGLRLVTFDKVFKKFEGVELLVL